MKRLMPAIIKVGLSDDRVRFRDRRGHYASSAMKDVRDQVRELLGEKRTNPTDFLGKMKMLLGNAVEAELVKSLFSKLYYERIYLLGTQVQVGGTEPVAWDGNMDVLLWDDESQQRFVVEVKMKSGYGADLLYENLEPQIDYVAQVGCYLRDLAEKGITDSGCLFYYLVSDSYIGVLLQFNYRYDKATKLLHCYEAISSDGLYRELNQTFDTELPNKRWKYVEECVAKKELPKGEFQYKYPLTEELLEQQSDATLRRMFEGKKVIGDWEALYSGYLNANLETDGEVRGYTQEEMQMITRHYLKRHPKSPMGKPATKIAKAK